ncbi:MAG: HEAT repeat domain-containing protein [Brevinematales bacterium]|nr:HEAT repeat domain-containing protein [Brevinematales bacterium]
MRAKYLVMGFVAALLFSANGFASDYVPEDLKIGGGNQSLETLKAQFFKTTDRDQQVIIVKMIAKHTSDEKYKVLAEITEFDIRTDKLGNFCHPDAVQTALDAIILTKDPKFETTYFNILNKFDNTKVRMTAAKGLAMIGSPNMVPKLVNMVKNELNYANFREDNQKMVADDMVVEAIITALGDIGDPRAFPALLQVVTLQNHRFQTIQAAWAAMEKIQW